MDECDRQRSALIKLMHLCMWSCVHNVGIQKCIELGECRFIDSDYHPSAARIVELKWLRTRL